MRKQILLFTAIIFLEGCGTSKLSEKEVIGLAEKYVFENGYTDQEIRMDSDMIQLDITERIVSKETAIELRKNTLEPKATFYSKGLRRWTVGFRTTRDSTRFRILRVYRNGKKILMEHQDMKPRYDL
ncbi:hypothetical protein [uncultured Allomuricauda sp.]|uniref:hypothetical protein n=1 Tax=Flagellimonas sp. W118 TaxID=3410791 RepID=UPI00262BAC3A|nr:hypothetical protein [uncultured Allomuricauda sp.]